MPIQSVPEAGAKSAITILGRIRKLAQGTAAMVLWTALVFASAGQIDWVRGWICVAVYVVTMLATGALVSRLRPGLLEARAKGMRKNTLPFDKFFMSIFFPLTYVQVLVAGLDAMRCRWMPMPQWTMAPGIVFFLAAMALTTWTFLVNPFAETTVRIQSDRGHKVVSEGPYRIVRHPMYVGSIVMYPATALMFGSGWAMAVAVLMVALIVWRTAKEDRFLQRELPGYEEFAAITRFRLVPGIWQPPKLDAPVRRNCSYRTPRSFSHGPYCRSCFSMCSRYPSRSRQSIGPICNTLPYCTRCAASSSRASMM